MKLSVVLALMVAGLFPALSIYAWQAGPADAYTENEAETIAVHYLRNAPTFRFDGISDSVHVEAIDALRRPWTWEVTISFQCRHAGYGDRTGKMVAQVITPHEIRVVVQRGQVIAAVIDEKWDELAQRERVQGGLTAAVSYYIGHSGLIGAA